MTRYALVGCGSQKLALEGDKGPVAIARLYTSNYFELKREYAKTCCDEYQILSAEHGLVWPDFYVEDSYDRTIGDLDETERREWVEDVGKDLRRLGELQPEWTIVCLAGQQYLAPLRRTLEKLPNDVEWPFDDTAGIGEQMGWLREEIDAAEADEPSDDPTDDQQSLGTWSE